MGLHGVGGRCGGRAAYSGRDEGDDGIRVGGGCRLKANAELVATHARAHGQTERIHRDTEPNLPTGARTHARMCCVSVG